MESQMYWELQPLGESTCGIHALNFILQGPVFRLSELEPIVEDCNNQERKFLIQAGLSEIECNKIISNENKGNFDFVVLEKALENKGYSCTRISKEKLSDEILHITNAFLINIGNHWVSSRYLGGKWLLADSKNETPENIEILEYLKGNIDNGYSVFLVRDKLGNHLPLFHHEHYVLASNQKFMPLNL